MLRCWRQRKRNGGTIGSTGKRYCERWGKQKRLFARVRWWMHTYEPNHREPEEELRTCLSFYHDLVGKLRFWDLMEFVNYLSARDGIAWALGQLGQENVDPAVLAEIEELDAELRDHASYLVHELELYQHIRRGEPEEHWWWYLDGEKPDGPIDARQVTENLVQPAEELSATALAEDPAPYEPRLRDEPGDQ